MLVDSLTHQPGEGVSNSTYVGGGVWAPSSILQKEGSSTQKSSQSLFITVPNISASLVNKIELSRDV